MAMADTLIGIRINDANNRTNAVKKLFLFIFICVRFPTLALSLRWVSTLDEVLDYEIQ